MSVLTPVVQTWDGANRLIYLKQGVSDFYPIEDIYHEYRYNRRTDEELRKYEPLLRAEGNVPKGAGAFTPRYVVLLDGTKIVPYDEVLRINQLGDMITDDADVDPSLYDVSTLTVPKVIFIKPSESETIQLNSEAIVYASFQGGVWLDPDSIYNDEGSASQPNGNTERPVNNLPLAVSIANTRGFDKIFVLKNITLDSGTDIENFTIVGKSRVNTKIIIDPSAQCSGLGIEKCNISGILDGNTRIKDCSVGDITYVNGHILNCGLYGTIILAGNEEAVLANCYTIDQDTPPIIDMGWSGQDLAMPNYSGIVTVKNLSSATEEIGIGLNAGMVTLTDTITAGTIIISGVGVLIDNSTGTTINTDGLMSKSEIANTVWDKQKADHIEPGSYGNELATKADIGAATSTNQSTAISGSVIYGTNTSGDYNSTYSRDNTYWQITEETVNGLTVEMVFNLPSEDNRPGVFNVFGRYEGVPSSTHHIELYAYNYETSSFEQLAEYFMPGGNTSDETWSNPYYERHIDRTNNNEVKIRLVHHITTYNNTHNLYIDYAEVTSIDVITAADIANAVWAEDEAQRVLGLLDENSYLDNQVYNGDGLLTSARKRIYSVAGSVGTTNDVIATYNITATYSGTQLSSYKMVVV